MYLIENTELLDPVHPWLHPVLKTGLKELLAYSQNYWDGLEVRELRTDGRQELLVKLCVGANAQGVYEFPFLQEDVCEALLEEVKHWRFSPNPEEAPEHQMQEAVLEVVCPPLARALKYLSECVLHPMFTLLYGVQPQVYKSIQLAKYRPGGDSMTAWHLDENSELTCTVALSNTARYKGGGLQVFPGIDCGRTPRGFASMFRGATCMHRSNPVLEGERALLVYWTDVQA